MTVTILTFYRRVVPVSLLVTAMICVWLIMMAGKAVASTQNCGFPSGMQALLLEMYNVTATGAAPDARAQLRIRALLGHMDHTNAGATFKHAREPEVIRAFDEIERQARAMGNRQPPSDLAALSDALDVIWTSSNVKCDDESEGGVRGVFEAADAHSSSKSGGLPGQGAQAKQLGLNQFASELSLENSEQIAGSYRWLAMILGGFSTVLLLLFASVASYGWIFALINGRKTCLVRAELELGLDVVDGHITILGRKGCRFVPVNDGAYARVVNLIEEMPVEVSLLIGQEIYVGAVHQLKDGNCAVFWDDPMRRAQRLQILSKSLVPVKISKRTRRDARMIQKGTLQAPKIEMPVIETEFDAPDLTNLADVPLTHPKDTPT